MPTDAVLRRGRRWFRWAVALVGVAATLFIYAPALRGEWLWDDNSEFTQNPDLVEPQGWWRAWVHPTGPDYFPLKTDLQWLEWRAFGPTQTLGYHLVSLALHGISACLFVLVLISLGMRRSWAALAGFFWLIHPDNVESVAWLAELKNTLSLPLLLGAFLSFLAFERRRSSGLYIVAAALFLAAMLAKSSVVMFPAVLLVYRWWRRGGLTRGDWRETFVFWAIAGAFGLVTIHFQHADVGSGENADSPGILARSVQAVWAICFYIYSAVCPATLTPIHARGSAVLQARYVWAPLLVFFVAGAGLWRLRAGKARTVAFPVLCFLLYLLPILGVIRMSFARQSWVSEHFLYIPLLPFCALLAMGLARLWHTAALGRAAAVGLASLIGIFYLSSARSYAGTFGSRSAFWTHALAVNPEAPAAHYNLGLVLLEQGQVDLARGHFESALALRPTDAPTMMALGEIAGAAGELGQALAWFARAEKADPDLADVYYNRGNVLARAGRLREAVADYRVAVRLAPRMADVHYNLGTALAQLGEATAAIGEYIVTLDLAPQMGSAHYNLGSLYAARSDLVAATPHFLAAAALLPGAAEVQSTAADALAGSGRAAQALTYFERALALEPHNNDIRQNYISVLRTLGRSREAMRQIDLIGRE